VERQNGIIVETSIFYDKNTMCPIKHSDYISVIIPAFNEENVIGKVVSGVKEILEHEGYQYEILVIDDGSVDNTADVATEAGADVLCRPYNMGNGAAVKHGIRNAKGKYLVMLDADGQHDPRDIPRMLNYFPEYDMVVGARSRESEGELPRNLANFLYNLLASYVVGHQVEDLTSGFRAIKGSLAKRVAYLFPNGYSYPSTSTIIVFRMGYGVKYVPIIAKTRIGISKIKMLRDGFRFLLIIIRIGIFFAPSRIFIPIAALVFTPGFIYAIYRLIIGKAWTLPIVISITGGLLFFMLGLISEQISMLRRDRTE
jgi:glycosyltransferase involved in cell wall biosynthesis